MSSVFSILCFDTPSASTTWLIAVITNKWNILMHNIIYCNDNKTYFYGLLFTIVKVWCLENCP